MNKILFALTLFLLAFIPLYPKRPLIDIQNTWVYIRGEDVFVALVILIWVSLLLFKKVALKTPLTLPVILYWIIGGLSTLHGVLLIFPTISDVFSNVAFLSFLRRIEYMFLFFVSYSAMKDKKYISYVSVTLAVVLLFVVGYGFGQKFLHFPAYLTMNEEFAKGVPIQLSDLSRVPSTFGGHYDLAAYLVLIIPLLISLIFGFKNIGMKIFLLITALFGFILLFMTVSRVSFFVLLLSLGMLLFLEGKKKVVISLLVVVMVSLSFSPKLLARFGNTVSVVDVLVDAKTGTALKQAKVIPSTDFDNKIIVRDFIPSGMTASSSAIIPNKTLPKQVVLAVEPNKPNGESLPQGTSYINLPLSPVVLKTSQYFYEKPNRTSTESAEIRVVYGDFLLKRAQAYDLSFTTRFQGEWPHTIRAFTRNIFIGSGYASVSLAVDNDYLRLLGESGLFGFISFASIFIFALLYIKKILPHVDSLVAKHFALGFIAGTFGLILNAVFIDVFEASKVAFTYWILMGVVIGTLHLYKTEQINLLNDFKRAIFSPYAVIVYLFIVTFALFSSVYDYYFVGDDFTWFRWISDCYMSATHTAQCPGVLRTITSYFVSSNGFFYRPGAKLYFYVMYNSFWLNQTVYHLVSIFLHFCAVSLVFLLARKILKDYVLGIAAAVLFLILSGHQEAVFWISATGFLFTTVFSLLSLLLYISWQERKKKIYFVFSFIFMVSALFFHELGIVVPLLIILYDVVIRDQKDLRESKKTYLTLMSPIVPYLILRFAANSHWFAGDYSYNIFKFPFNAVGNMIGYASLFLFGPSAMPVYQGIRTFSRAHPFLVIPICIALIFCLRIVYRKSIIHMDNTDKKIVIFGFLFFAVSLLPFLGLGNITSRYSYLASVGLAMIFVFFLKKIYTYLLFNGRDIVIAIIMVIAIIFSSIHLFQLQRINTDWEEAGDKTKAFLISLDEVYNDNWTRGPMQFYFANVPILNGNAWVFPVGLGDATWFVFRNEKIIINQVPTVSDAFDRVQIGARNQKVFEFQSYGNVVEKQKPQTK